MSSVTFPTAQREVFIAFHSAYHGLQEFSYTFNAESLIKTYGMNESYKNEHLSVELTERVKRVHVSLTMAFAGKTMTIDDVKTK